VTTLTDRPNTALLVIDVQNDVMAGTHDRDRVVANVATLVEKARAADAAVVWVQHGNDENLAPGSDGWQYVPELVPEASEPVVHKRYGDAFEATTLESELARRRVGRLVVAGAQTDECVRCTIHGAFTRGYDTTLVGDAHTAEDLTEYGAPPPEAVIANTNLYWGYLVAPGRTAGVVDTDAVVFDRAVVG
jgi:nicotinamidase-related amidase